MLIRRFCESCIARRGLQFRQLSTGSQASKTARLSRREVLEVSGPDASKFLKGLTCKDVEGLGGGYSGFLNASGRVLHTVFIFVVAPDKYLISHSSDHPAPLLTHLAPFKLRSKVRLKDVSQDWDHIVEWNVAPSPSPSREWKSGSGGAIEAIWSWPDGTANLSLRSGEIGCWDFRAGAAKQILSPKGTRSDELSVEHDYKLHRMLVGLPEGPGELIPGQALPLESCMDIHGGLDFRKGCYVGQELTVRTYHTGATRKRILPIRLFSIQRGQKVLESDIIPYPPVTHTDIMYHPPPNSPIKRSKSAGRILALHDIYGTVGLGLVRVELAERSWWSQPVPGSVDEWLDGAHGRLTTNVDGQELGVHVAPGIAYGDAMHSL